MLPLVPRPPLDLLLRDLLRELIVRNRLTKSYYKVGIVPIIIINYISILKNRGILLILNLELKGEITYSTYNTKGRIASIRKGKRI